MFDGLPTSTFDIIAPDGSSRGQVEAIATGKELIVPNEAAIIQPGDEMRRSLPNGLDETYEVTDPVFVQKTFGIPSHFQVHVRKKGTFTHGTGGNYTISVNGANSRVNISSTDNSTNINVDQSVIAKIRQALQEQVGDAEQRAALLAALAKMEQAKDKPALSAAYQQLISAAANHMSVIAPFLPALGQMFGS